MRFSIPLQGAKMRTGIYAVYDRVACLVVGMLLLERHDASAVRWFSDLLSNPNGFFAKHVEDVDLVRLGYLADPETVGDGDQWITPDFTPVLSGVQWKALNDAKGAVLGNGVPSAGHSRAEILSAGLVK